MRIWPAAFLAFVCSGIGIVAADVGQQEPTSPLPVVQVPATPSFPEWLAAVRAEALSRGVREETINHAFTNLEPVATVLERDRNQAELTLTLDQYLARRLTRSMIKTAQRVSREHARLLTRVSAKYGVAPGIVVAVWGLESNFGRFSGVRPTIATLATLAYDQRRGAMFREELINALLILDSGDVEPAAFRGSWAGAIGQPQFMPSSFLQYAQDFDGDGKRDIWTSTPDVFASIANYLSAHGWNPKQTWGREVKLPPKLSGDALNEAAPLQTTGCLAQRQMTIRLPLAKWSALGVKTATGTPLPRAAIDAALVSTGRRHFLLYPNYDAILSYNCVHAYGLSVALLSDRLP